MLATVEDETANPEDNGVEASEGVDAAEESTAPVNPLEEAKGEAARLKDQLLRTAADFDNFRKRARKEQQDAQKQGRDDLLRDLLPVFDNLERAVSHAGTATDVQSLADGIQMVMRQFVDTLGKMGIERVTSVGSPFDPAVHEAIQNLETTEFPPGTIAAEVQGGYRAGDRLVRPALVVVAKAPTAPAEEEESEPANGTGAS